MNRDTFMKELEYLLQDMNEEEKEDALQYYKDYLDEAGPEREEAVIKEFGSPERIASIIRSSVAGNMEEGGEFTETGYGDERFRDPNYQVQKKYDLPEEKMFSQKKEEKKQPWTSKPLIVALWIILIIVAAPMIWALGTGALGTIFSIIVAIFVLFAGIGILAAVFMLGGLAAFVAGMIWLFQSIGSGLICIGAGLFMMGMGVILFLVAIWFYGTVVPWAFHKAGDWCDKIFHKKERKTV